MFFILKLGKSTKVIVIVVAIVFVLGFLVIGSYNSLVSAQEVVNEKQATINTQLQRRNDLIPNLVNTVKGYATHEEEIFTNIANARAKLAGANGDVEKMADADAELSSALSRLMVVVENYPDLKANQNFIALQDELAGTENRITQARNDYNDSAKKYNLKIKKFPSNIFAGIFGFEEVEYFEAEEGAQKVPEVNF